jgi:hypothetical protein
VTLIVFIRVQGSPVPRSVQGKITCAKRLNNNLNQIDSSFIYLNKVEARPNIMCHITKYKHLHKQDLFAK